MNNIVAEETLREFLDAYENDEHGDYFYNHSIEMTEAIKIAYRYLANLNKNTLYEEVSDDERRKANFMYVYAGRDSFSS
jgi:hypothetical protein